MVWSMMEEGSIPSLILATFLVRQGYTEMNSMFPALLLWRIKISIKRRLPNKKKVDGRKSPTTYMGVSKNSGIPKWIVYNGKPYQNGWFGGTIHINCSMLWEPSSPSGSSVFDGWITHIHAANFHFSTKGFPHLWNWCFHPILQCRPCFPGNGPKKTHVGLSFPKHWDTHTKYPSREIPKQRKTYWEQEHSPPMLMLMRQCSIPSCRYAAMPLCHVFSWWFLSTLDYGLMYNEW